MKRTTAAASVAALFAILPGASLADCAFTVPGSVVTCDLTDADGFDDDGNNLTVNILPGATVNGSDGIKVEGSGNAVTNEGEVVTTDEGIVVGEGATVTNNGLVDAGDKGIDADDLDDVTVVNTGEVLAVDKGIRIGNGDNASITNSSAASIRAGDEAVEAGDNAIVDNAGEIISSGDDAVQIGADGNITNAGVIRSSGDDAIDIDSGMIFNNSSGAIVSTADAAIDFDEGTGTGTIDNNGVITGTIGVLTDPGNTGSQIITNSGFLEGTDGFALMLGAGDDSYTHEAGGVLVGATDFGSGEDSFMFDTVLSGLFADGAVMDGGADFDTLTFAAYTPDDLDGFTNEGSFITLMFGGDSVNVRSWENLNLGGTTIALSDLTPVPLPAGVWGLLAALGMLGWMRRKA